MRIALLSSGLGIVRRGIEVWMEDLAHWMPKDVEVELWCGGPAPRSPGRISRTVRAWSRDSRWLSRLTWHRRYHLEQLSALPGTLFHARRRGIDLIYCGDPALAWQLKKRQSWHGARVVFMNGMRLSPRWACHFDGVHLLAPPYLQEARSEVGEDAARRFFAVPHCVSGEVFRPATDEERRAARRAWGIPDEAFVVLTVGPVGSVSGKRLEWLAGEVAALGEGAVLVSAGVEEDGADEVRAKSRGALGNRFLPLGPVERRNMGALYHASDVYSLGSLAEPFSIAILEALASGLPVVHHPDTVMQWQTGAGGRAASMTVPGEAARALRALRDDAELRRATCHGARSLALDRYSPTVVCRALADELVRVLAREKARP